MAATHEHGSPVPVTLSPTVDRARTIALEVAIALMLISGVSPLAGFLSQVEHLPYGLAVAILVGRRPSKLFLGTIAAAAVFWTASHFYWGDWGNWVYLVQFVNVLTPILFFKTLRAQLERTARWVFWAFIVFGLLQWFRVLVGTEAFFENFIPRFRSGRENGYRGVASFESEPARAAFQMFMLFVIARKRFMNQWVALIALVLAQVLLLRATTGLMLTAVFLGLLVIRMVRERPKLAPVLLVGALVVSFAAITMNPKLEVIFETTLDDGITGFIDTMTATSGGRYLALQDSVEDIITQPLGRGADPSYFSDLRELVEGSNVTGYPIERGARPVSAVLNSIRTFGVPIALLAGWLVFRELFDGTKPDLNVYFWFVVICSLVYGPSGSEALLIALGCAGIDATERPARAGPDPVPVPTAV